MAKYSLYLGKDTAANEYLLCLTDQDSGDVYRIAAFDGEAHMQVFTDFMETQGYLALKLPSDDDLDKLLDNE